MSDIVLYSFKLYVFILLNDDLVCDVRNLFEYLMLYPLAMTSYALCFKTLAGDMLMPTFAERSFCI